MNVFGLFLFLAAALAPAACRACACGCGVFDVGTSSMFPQAQGGTLDLEYDYQDQTHNWSGSSRAPAANNDDKEIRTHFVTVGLQYMFSRQWGMELEVPYENRFFKTTGGASGNDIVSLNWGDLGDIRVKALYTGLSDDLSTGITLGFKLPTGSYSYNDSFGDVDRDSEIGTGSTDILVGGYHRQNLTSDARWNWFVQGELDLPVLTRNEYCPGVEVDAAAGIYYSGWQLGRLKISPVAQVIGSERTRDTGSEAASPVASGYQRVILSPGIELHLHPMMLYADVELPVYEHVTGNQLVSPALFKLILSYQF